MNMSNNNNEIWVFLSHSNKDYEKVVKLSEFEIEKQSVLITNEMMIDL